MFRNFASRANNSNLRPQGNPVVLGRICEIADHPRPVAPGSVAVVDAATPAGSNGSGPASQSPELVARNLPVDLGCHTADVRLGRVPTHTGPLTHSEAARRAAWILHVLRPGSCRRESRVQRGVRSELSSNRPSPAQKAGLGDCVIGSNFGSFSQAALRAAASAPKLQANASTNCFWKTAGRSAWRLSSVRRSG